MVLRGVQEDLKILRANPIKSVDYQTKPRGMSAAAQVGGKGLYLEPMALEARGGTDIASQHQSLFQRVDSSHEVAKGLEFPGTAGPGGLPSTRSHRVGHD